MKNSKNRSNSKNNNSNYNNNNDSYNKKKKPLSGFDVKNRSIPRMEKVNKNSRRELVSPKTIDYSKSSIIF